LRTAVTARNSNQIGNPSHALLGSVATFGTKRAVEAARKLESIGRRGKVKGVDEAFSVLEREFALATSFLEQVANDSD
jgi:HPt (histidine-containing phosphotransfer) domain-containing protein